MPLTKRQFGYNEAVLIRAEHPDASADDIKHVRDDLKGVLKMGMSLGILSDGLIEAMEGGVEAHEDMRRAMQ
jgi:hypothetical protein